MTDMQLIQDLCCFEQMGSVHVDNCTDVEENGFCFLQSDGRALER